MKNIQLIIQKKINNPKNNKCYLHLSSYDSNIITFQKKKTFFEQLNLYLQLHFLLFILIFICIFIIFKYT